MKKLTLLTLTALGLCQVAGAVDLARGTSAQPGLIPPLTVFHVVAISEVRANNVRSVPAAFWVEDLTAGRTKETKCEVTFPVRLDVATERIFIDRARPAELSCPLWKHPVKVKGNLTESIEPGPAHAMNGLAAHNLRDEHDQAQPLFTATIPPKAEASFITMEDVTVPDARGIVH